MLKAITLALTIAVATQACADPKTIDGITYDTYGLFNESEKKNPQVEYHLSVGNVIWSIILIETVVFPIYFLGFSLYEPIGRKGEVIKGAL